MLEVIGSPSVAIALISLAHDREVTVVYVDKAGLQNFNRAVEVAATGRPVLLLSPRQPHELAADRRYHIAMSYPNVRYETLPLNEIDVLDILDEMLEERPVRLDNPLVRAAFSAMESPDQAPLAGQTFNVACCTVVAAILRHDGTIDPRMLQLLEGMSVDRPFVLWAGEDHDAIEQRLREEGIATPLIPKKLLRGTTVTVAFDDVPQEDLVAAYGINVVTYHRVP